jgi:hypothetical protein
MEGEIQERIAQVIQEMAPPKFWGALFEKVIACLERPENRVLRKPIEHLVRRTVYLERIRLARKARNEKVRQTREQ